MSTSGSVFAYPWAWLLVAALPLLWLVMWLGDRLRYRLAGELAGLAGMQSVFRRGLVWQRMGLGLASLLIVVGSAGPQWGRDPKLRIARGRDVVIALDISRSMLAEDRTDPGRGRLASRLQRAKHYLSDFLDVLERRGGHRIGLVWFAGQARLVCPLTDDYEHIRTLVDLADPDYWGPAGRLAATEHGVIGTSLRQAVAVAIDAHDPQARGFQDIVLVTDGDDLDVDASSVAHRAREHGIRIHVIGVGRPQPPALIPSRETARWLEVDGRLVTTQRNDRLLAHLAQLTGGQYLPEEDYPQPLVHWFTHYLQREAQREWSPLGPPRPQQHSGWFFALALALMLVALA